MFLKRKKVVLYKEGDSSIPAELLERLKRVEKINADIEKTSQRIYLEIVIQVLYMILTFIFLVKGKYIFSTVSITTFFLIIKSIKDKNKLKSVYVSNLIEEVKQLEKFKN